jgi:hypothetical protein
VAVDQRVCEKELVKDERFVSRKQREKYFESSEVEKSITPVIGNSGEIGE